MSEDYFFIGDIKIFPEKVNAYLQKEHIETAYGKLFPKAFEEGRFWQSQAERTQFLSYLGFSEEGVEYYFDNGLETDLTYDIYTILSRTALFNELEVEHGAKI